MFESARNLYGLVLLYERRKKTTFIELKESCQQCRVKFDASKFDRFYREMYFCVDFSRTAKYKRVECRKQMSNVRDF